MPQDRSRDGPPVSRDELEELSPLRVEAAHALLDDLLERGPGVEDERVRIRRQPLSVRASSQVLDEERATSRAPRDGIGHAFGGFVVAADQIQRETSRILEPERLDEDASDVGAVEALLDEFLEERAGLCVDALALAEDEQEPRRVGRSHDLEKEGRAVDVAPVNVVDVQDRRTEARQLREERAQRRKRALPHALRVVDGVNGQRCDRIDPPQHREETRKRPCVRRQRNGRAALLEGHQATTERIDHAVDRLVGDGLALVGASAQDHRIAARHQAVEEVLNESGLAHPRRAHHAHDHAASRPSGHEGLVQRPQLAAPTHQRRTMMYARDWSGAEEPVREDAQSAQHLATGRTLFGRPPQKVGAERVEIFGHTVDELGRRGRLDHRLAVEDVDCVAHEWGLAHEGLVEQGADAVPIACRGEPLVEGLLGSHVCGRPHHVGLEQSLVDHPSELGRHSEVQEDDPTVVADEDVRRLDVPGTLPAT